MNNELRQLADSARQVITRQGLAADEQENWQIIIDLGWLMVALPEAQGGLGMGPEARAILYREMGRGLATTPFLSQMLAIDAVAESDALNASLATLLENMVSGHCRVSTSLAASRADIFDEVSDALVISGQIVAVPSLDQAQYVLMSTTDQNCVALVALTSPGVSCSQTPTWDETRSLFELELDNVRVPLNRVLARGPSAAKLCRRLMIQRDFALACDCVGAAAELLDKTVAYLQTRQQFGRPLALFQALKHRCADLKAEVEAADALLRASLAISFDASGNLVDGDVADNAACETKKLSSDAFVAVAEEALQLHGGIGMTAEHECHLFLKRALLNEHLGGHADRYTTELASRYLALV